MTSTNKYGIRGDKSFANLLSAPDANLRQAHSKEWFRKQAQQVSGVNLQRLSHNMEDRFTTKLVFGRMYLYNYDPKLKKKLPYYDTYPLVFPIDKKEEGFLG